MILSYDVLKPPTKNISLFTVEYAVGIDCVDDNKSIMPSTNLVWFNFVNLL